MQYIYIHVLRIAAFSFTKKTYVQYNPICHFLQCDGVPLNLSDGPQLQGITFLNIPSTHGGTNMWGDSKARRRRSSSSKKSKKKQQDQGASVSSVTDIDLSLAVQGEIVK